MLTPGYRLRLTVESSKRAVKDTNIHFGDERASCRLLEASGGPGGSLVIETPTK
jgi:hypothetical protein